MADTEASLVGNTGRRRRYQNLAVGRVTVGVRICRSIDRLEDSQIQMTQKDPAVTRGRVADI